MVGYRPPTSSSFLNEWYVEDSLIIRGSSKTMIGHPIPMLTQFKVNKAERNHSASGSFSNCVI